MYNTSAYSPPVSFFTAWTFTGKDLTGLTVVNVTAGAGQARLLADAAEACADTAGNVTENTACVADWDSKDERKVGNRSQCDGHTCTHGFFYWFAAMPAGQPSWRTMTAGVVPSLSTACRKYAHMHGQCSHTISTRAHTLSVQFKHPPY